LLLCIEELIINWCGTLKKRFDLRSKIGIFPLHHILESGNNNSYGRESFGDIVSIKSGDEFGFV